MKALTTAGLTKLIQLIKSSFISVDDTVTTTTVTLADVATTGDYDDLTNKPTIPTESTVSGWGFTKNTGTVTSVNNIQPVDGNVTIEIPDSATWGNITGTLSNQTDLQNALEAKQDDITGGASTITSNDLTASRALVSNSSGKVVVSDVTSTELGYLDGVTSSVQTQLNNKQPTLVSGTNIKTVNNNSLLGSGNINIDSLPSQSGQSGKYLTTNGTTASWATVTIPTPTYDSTNERITW